MNDYGQLVIGLQERERLICIPFQFVLLLIM